MGFIAKTLGEAAHEVHEVGGLDPDGLEIRDHASQLRGFVFYGLLQTGKARCGTFWGRNGLAAEDVKLDFDAEKGLENSVMKISCNAGTFGFDGSSAKMPQKKKIFDRRTDMTSHALKPVEIFLLERFLGALAVEDKDAAGRLIALIECNRHERANGELVLG
jgi:hypothetical protein